MEKIRRLLDVHRTRSMKARHYKEYEDPSTRSQTSSSSQALREESQESMQMFKPYGVPKEKLMLLHPYYDVCVPISRGKKKKIA